MLLGELPALTKFYGLRPWDLERMTLREIYFEVLAGKEEVSK